MMHQKLLAENQSLAAIAVDYQHGDCEPSHSHSCSQLIHALSGVVQVSTHHGVWMVPPGRGVWLPAHVTHSLRFIGGVQARTLFVDSLARADLPDQCQVVQVSPLLRELILASFSVPVDYMPGGRDERIIELILDELRLLPILPLHLPEPGDAQLMALCQQIQQDLLLHGSLRKLPSVWASAGVRFRGVFSARPACASVTGLGGQKYYLP